MFQNSGHMLIEFVRSAWFAGLVALVIWIVLASAVRRLSFGWMRRSSMRHQWNWIDSFLALVAPILDLAIFVIGVGVVSGFMPIPTSWQATVSIVLKSGMVLMLIVFADRFVTLWMRHAGSRFTMLGEGYGLVTGALRGLIIGVGSMMLLESVGISIGPILASLGIGSLAIALALQDTLKNMFSGFFVVADKPLEVGDFVKLESGQEGWLVKLGWRSSKFRMANDGSVVVPNSRLVDSVVTNYRAGDGHLALAVDLNVVAPTELERVEQATLEVARDVMHQVQGGVARFEPFLRFRSVGGASIAFTVSMRASSGASIDSVRHEFIKRLTDRYQHENIKLS